MLKKAEAMAKDLNAQILQDQHNLFTQQTRNYYTKKDYEYVTEDSEIHTDNYYEKTKWYADMSGRASCSGRWSRKAP